MSRPNHVWRSIGVGLSLVPVVLALRGMDSHAQPDIAPPTVKTTAIPADSIRRIGSDSCVARGCHGAVGATDAQHGKLYLKGGEATTWASFDPHSRAYDVLLNPRSVRIAKLLSKDLGGKPAHQAKLCLDCHSIGGEPTAADIKAGKNDFAAGVDCETCHGPASAWLEPHLTKEWTDSKTDKAKYGYRSLVELPVRAKLCVTCHVGDSTKEVNHDLIAAGHPRLIFELAAYQRSLPRHWQEPFEKPDAKVKADDFHAKAWAIGQVTTVSANVDLLKTRATNAKAGHAPWPEFTEYDCFSCHHELANPSWRQVNLGHRPPGTLPWGTFTLPTTSALANASGNDEVIASLGKLRVEMMRPLPDPERVAALADEASKLMNTWKSNTTAFKFDAAKVESLLHVFLDSTAKPLNWDDAAARSLAATALADAYADITGKSIDPATAKESEKLRATLGFPESTDSPRGYHP